MFKRRNRRNIAQALAHSLYPKGGWGRAVRYIGYRVRRLPDPAHKISLGIAIGIFVTFSPFYGLHFLLSAFFAWVLRCNVVAALLATFFGNPLTFPFIAQVSIFVGYEVLDKGNTPPIHEVLKSFGRAMKELWWNFSTFYSDRLAQWDWLYRFYDDVFIPYLIGGLIPGFIAAAVGYFASRPMIAAYQRARIKRLKKRYQARSPTANRSMSTDARMK